ncbi:hypothetical protein AMAG_10552 [Allomyces macrogynus ATCC 38327]|uniref:Uncharacterized protein n=1 Tax=Allomyces macrogynus (strain ATCC 38327) TaxID=578462 RepID=A0A0L0SUR8_ALLM3|nr:hypothetical protein AMAG_10552 [Allomyces macrogynus ATCC 38327]|eukprot:KNE66328.1 hypothetical protein AMAG_10552 [Allomyces macrogynus ATCC 38327]
MKRDLVHTVSSSGSGISQRVCGGSAAAAAPTAPATARLRPRRPPPPCAHTARARHDPVLGVVVPTVPPRTSSTCSRPPTTTSTGPVPPNAPQKPHPHQSSTISASSNFPSPPTGGAQYATGSVPARVAVPPAFAAAAAAARHAAAHGIGPRPAASTTRVRTDHQHRHSSSDPTGGSDHHGPSANEGSGHGSSSSSPSGTLLPSVFFQCAAFPGNYALVRTSESRCEFLPVVPSAPSKAVLAASKRAAERARRRITLIKPSKHSLRGSGHGSSSSSPSGTLLPSVFFQCAAFPGNYALVRTSESRCEFLPVVPSAPSKAVLAASKRAAERARRRITLIKPSKHSLRGRPAVLMAAETAEEAAAAEEEAEDELASLPGDKRDNGAAPPPLPPLPGQGVPPEASIICCPRSRTGVAIQDPKSRVMICDPLVKTRRMATLRGGNDHHHHHYDEVASHRSRSSGSSRGSRNDPYVLRLSSVKDHSDSRILFFHVLVLPEGHLDDSSSVRTHDSNASIRADTSSAAAARLDEQLKYASALDLLDPAPKRVIFRSSDGRYLAVRMPAGYHQSRPRRPGSGPQVLANHHPGGSMHIKPASVQVASHRSRSSGSSRGSRNDPYVLRLSSVKDHSDSRILFFHVLVLPEGHLDDSSSVRTHDSNASIRADTSSAAAARLDEQLKYASALDLLDPAPKRVIFRSSDGRYLAVRMPAGYHQSRPRRPGSGPQVLANHHPGGSMHIKPASVQDIQGLHARDGNEVVLRIMSRTQANGTNARQIAPFAAYFADMAPIVHFVQSAV